MNYECTVYDRCEGTLHLTVQAKDEHDAYDEAEIAAAENGCRNVTEVVVGVFE